MFYRSLFVLSSFFFWPMYCLFFFDLQTLITLLASFYELYIWFWICSGRVIFFALSFISYCNRYIVLFNSSSSTNKHNFQTAKLGPISDIGSIYKTSSENIALYNVQSNWYYRFVGYLFFASENVTTSCKPSLFDHTIMCKRVDSSKNISMHVLSFSFKQKDVGNKICCRKNNINSVWHDR
jgi:hypothetical protein